MQSSFIKKLSFCIYKTNVSAQNNRGSKLDTFGIVITFFLVNDKDEKFYFFEEVFLLVNINMTISLEMLFLTLSDVKINFTDWELK